MSFLDLTNVKTDDEIIPNGDYVIRCEKAEVKDTKDGSGQYINCVFKIISGDYRNRTIFNMFNIKNRNEKAVQIGLGQLKKFLVASNVSSMQISSPHDLEGMSCVVTTKIKNDDFGDKVTITNFKKLTEQTSPTNESEIPF